MQLATLCYLTKDDQTLMLHRVKKDKDIHQSKWTGLGGKFHQGESPEDCVIREVKEESGFDIYAPQLRGILTFPLFKDNQDWVVFLFQVADFTGQMFECDEGVLEWVDNDKIFDLNLWDGDKLFLDWMKQNKFFSAKFCYQNKKLIKHDVIFYE